MSSIFSRIFKIGQAEAHSVIDNLEDPIKMTEQGIRDLKESLQKAMVSLAEVKGIAIRTRGDADRQKQASSDYEKKAMTLLQQMQNGSMDKANAERLAMEALNKKETATKEAARLSQEAERHEKMADQLQVNVNKIKSSISTYENDLTTLKARARTAESTKKVNQELAKIDPSGTVAMLEKMKAKVEREESLAVAYGDIVNSETNVDREIDAAIAKGQVNPASDQLAELKKKMGIS